jgi:hypothetical protein
MERHLRRSQELQEFRSCRMEAAMLSVHGNPFAFPELLLCNSEVR